MKNLIKVSTVSVVALTLILGLVSSSLAGSFMNKNFRSHVKRAKATGVMKMSTGANINKGKQVIRSNSKRQQNRLARLSRNLKMVRPVKKLERSARVIPTNPIPTLPPSTGPTFPIPTNPTPPPQVGGTQGDKPEGEVAHFLIGPLGKRVIVWAVKTVILTVIPAAATAGAGAAADGIAGDQQRKGSQCEESSCEWKTE